MKLYEILEELEAVSLINGENLELEIYKCGGADLMSDILAGSAEDSILLTGLPSVQVIKTAMIAGVKAVIFVRNKRPPQEVIDYAHEQRMPLFTCPYSMFVSCGRLHGKGLTGLDGAR
jgi:hypothetical protein